MLKKTITYTDYNGVSRTEDFYFNFTEAELSEMQMSQNSVTGYTEDLESRARSNNARTIFQTFKDIILKSYGVRSDDGRRFVKSEELSTAFSQTEAYNVLFKELTASDDAMINFITAIIPKELAKQSAVQIEDIKKQIEDGSLAEAQ